MTGRTKHIINELAWGLVFWLCVAVLAVMLFTMLGCASGSSSEITPAKSEAFDKTLTVTAPAKRAWKVTVTSPGAPAVEEGEDK